MFQWKRIQVAPTQDAQRIYSAVQLTVPSNDKLSRVPADIQVSENYVLYLSLQLYFILHLNIKHLLHSFDIPVLWPCKSREGGISSCSKLCQESVHYFGKSHHWESAACGFWNLQYNTTSLFAPVSTIHPTASFYLLVHHTQVFANWNTHFIVIYLFAFIFYIIVKALH